MRADDVRRIVMEKLSDIELQSITPEDALRKNSYICGVRDIATDIIDYILNEEREFLRDSMHFNTTSDITSAPIRYY